MEFNSDKFECLRYWPRGQKPDLNYFSPDGTVIEEKPHLRDLEMSASCGHQMTKLTSASWKVLPGTSLPKSMVWMAWTTGKG